MKCYAYIRVQTSKSHSIFWFLGIAFKIKHHFNPKLPSQSHFYNASNHKSSQFRHYFHKNIEPLATNFAFVFCYCGFALILGN